MGMVNCASAMYQQSPWIAYAVCWLIHKKRNRNLSMANFLRTAFIVLIEPTVIGSPTTTTGIQPPLTTATT